MINDLIASYLGSAAYRDLRPTSKKGYKSRIEALREQHGHRTVEGLSRDGIERLVLGPYSSRPGAKLATLKMLRILIRHAIEIDWLDRDPSAGIRRPKTKEVRAWTETEIQLFRARWPIGSLQRTAFEIMLNVGTAVGDVHRITWAQVDQGVHYARNKTGVAVDLGLQSALQTALEQTPRAHLTIINTAFGKPFSVKGFGQWMRAAMTKAGLPLDAKPHGLRKALGRRLAEAGCTAHEIMAVLGHKTLAEAERYTR